MLRDDLTHALRAALAAAGVDPPESIHLERPARRDHGDWSSNVALATAKKAGRNPRELGQRLVDHLAADPPRHVTAVELAGAGFVNFHLAPTWLHDVLRDVVAGGVDGYARPDLGRGRKVNVEFVSANPNGPLHAGHGRGAAYGDALARILIRTGHDVTREFYLNDRGLQMQNYAASLAARKRGEPVPEDGYHGEYVADWAAEMPDDADPLEWGYARALADQREVLAAFGVDFDVWFSERSLVASGAMAATLDDLRARGVVEERDGAVWFLSTRFGDDKDRVLVRSDGEPTYLLPDIAYHRDKLARGFELLIDVWGADHHGHIVRVRGALQALGLDAEAFEVPIVQMVNLQRDGQPVKLGKRSGDIIELRDVIDEVGADAARLTYLLQSVDTRQTFDLDVATSQSMDNPVFYVQMAHARIRSIQRKAGDEGVALQPIDAVDLSLLDHERELDVLRSLSELPDLIVVAANDRAPHKVTTWSRELAGAFHGFYHDCYVIAPSVPAELTQARLWLVESARIGLRIGLDLLGVTAPESM